MMEGTLERQVIEAALITTRPTSGSQQRSEASSSLEQWTSSCGSGGVGLLDNECWEAYINIIRISFNTAAPLPSLQSNPSTPVSTPHSSFGSFIPTSP